MSADCVGELKTARKSSSHNLMTQSFPTGIGNIMKCEYSSTLTQLLRIIRLLKRKLKKPQKDDVTRPYWKMKDYGYWKFNHY